MKASDKAQALVLAFSDAAREMEHIRQSSDWEYKRIDLLDYIARLEAVAEAARTASDDAASNEEGTLYDVPSEKMRALIDAIAALDASVSK